MEGILEDVKGKGGMGRERGEREMRKRKGR